jgi:hypothetical protein
MHYTLGRSRKKVVPKFCAVQRMHSLSVEKVKKVKWDRNFVRLDCSTKDACIIRWVDEERKRDINFARPENASNIRWEDQDRKWVINFERLEISRGLWFNKKGRDCNVEWMDLSNIVSWRENVRKWDLVDWIMWKWDLVDWIMRFNMWVFHLFNQRVHESTLSNWLEVSAYLYN